jgi:hypothetical protein
MFHVPVHITSNDELLSLVMSSISDKPLSEFVCRSGADTGAAGIGGTYTYAPISHKL